MRTLRKLSAACESAKLTLAKRDDLMSNESKLAQARDCRLGESLKVAFFSWIIGCFRLNYQAVGTVRQPGLHSRIAIPLPDRIAEPFGGRGEIDEIGQAETTFNNLLRPPRDPFDKHRDAAELGHDGVLSGFDAFGQGNFLLSGEPLGITHLAKVDIKQVARGLHAVLHPRLAEGSYAALWLDGSVGRRLRRDDGDVRIVLATFARAK
jgi:hypothetical protein